jgi:hypothetical protein
MVSRLLGVATCAAVAVALSGCSGGDSGLLPGGATTTFGPEQAVGNGLARSFVVTDNQDKPVSIGINFTAAALANLPTTDTMFSLPLPAGVAAPPFNHLTLNWNTHGHEPAGVDDVTHFDAHF